MDCMLYIVATPIGNLGDFSKRATETLGVVDIILCEDTRVTRKLLDHVGLEKRLVPYNDHNAARLVPQIINSMKNGNVKYALVSDAGTPIVSDPGYKLVNACIENNIKYSMIPGPCSVVSALVLSGLPSHRFLFDGFADPKHFAELSKIDSTLIMFESPNRLISTLSELRKFFLDRKIAIVREISKIFEEVVSGNCDFLLRHFEQNEPKGEIVIVISPPEKQNHLAIKEFYPLIMELCGKVSAKDLSLAISTYSGISKNKIYDFIKEIKND